MTKILLCTHELDGEWCYKSLKHYIRSDVKVLLLTFALKTSLDSVRKPFLSYGVPEENVKTLDLGWEGVQGLLEKIQECDLICLVGSHPEKMCEILERQPIKEELLASKKIVIGMGAGAQVLLDRYHITPYEEERTDFYYGRGLGLVRGMDLELDYDCSYGRKMAIRRAGRELKKHIYALTKDGGVIIAKGQITPIGNVTVFEG